MEQTGAMNERIKGVWLPVLLCAGVYLVSVAVRLVEVSQWAHPGLMVNGEHILATHDSYFWTAAAKGVRIVHNSLLPEFTRLLAGMTGASLGQVAFWTPLFMSSLLAPVTCLWGMLLGGRWAGLAAGALGALAPGFFSRTRLGYYDTDMFTLLMPVLAALLLAWLLRGSLRSGWLPGREEEEGEQPSWRFVIILGAVAGLVARFAWWWHEDIFRVLVVLFLGAVALVLILGRPGLRVRTLWGLALFALFGLVGGVDTAWITGSVLFKAAAALLGGVHDLGRIKGAVLLSDLFWLLLVAAAVVVATRLRGRAGAWLASPWTTGVVVGVLALLMIQATFLDVVWSRLAPYLNPAAVSGGQAASSSQAAGPIYPSVVQSIIEAKLVGWVKVMQRMGPFAWGSVLGVIGFFWVCWKRPLAVFLLPLLLLGLGGHWMGIRFTMFGGPMVALGLGVSLAWLTRLLPVKGGQSWLEPVVQLAVGLVLIVPLAVRYAGLPPTPVVDQPHAEALIELGETAPDKAMVWTWWDWGYATQYYTGHMSINDGGLHDGRDLYPLAVALSTSSLDQANNMIRYAASQDYRPADTWDAMSGTEVAAFVNGLKNDAPDTPSIAPQYLVVGWHDFKILEWISRFGNWDLVAGKGTAGTADRIRGFRFDPSRGAVVFDKGGAVPVCSVDSLEPNLVNHKDYWLNSGPHLVFNQHRGDAYLMDDAAYNSVLVQLMLKKPREVSKYFELVYDGMPHVRVFRVKGS